MLAPDARAVLIDQLRPPPGYKLDYAVATTFTLDLAAALVPPLAFAQFRASSTGPIAMMEAVHSSADRFDIFCQAGRMKAAGDASNLVAFLEQVVHEVRHPRPGRLFHPKLWLLRYTAGDDRDDTYRLLCLTRNLTLDRSHDIVLRLDGEPVGRRLAVNRPLAELIRTLPSLTVKPLPSQRAARLEELAEQVRRIEWDQPDDVNAVLFHVLGLPGRGATPDFSGYRHLVVSPFCTDGGLDYVAPPDSRDVTVVSRPKELDRLSPETVKAIAAYVVIPLARLDEPGSDPEGASEQPPPAELHAKLYVAERARRAHVFIGSANATDAAFEGNVEFLVELVGGATKLGVDTFLGPKAPFAMLLEPYKATGGASPDPKNDERWKLEQALAAVAEVGYEATVTSDGIDYAIVVTSEKPLMYPPALELHLELLTRPGLSFLQTPEAAAKANFTGVPLADVTPFVVLRMVSPGGLSARTVVRAELVGDPVGRLDAIVARQLDTTEKFLQFIELLLGLEAEPEFSAGVAERGGTRSPARLAPGNGLFELLVSALADRPEALADLDRTIRRLRAAGDGERVLPEGFDELWRAVLGARDELEAATGD